MANGEKKWLVEGFCPVDGFQCLMPVAYEPVEEAGVVKEYKKKAMACRHALSDACEKAGECTFLKDAPDRIEKDATWYEG